MVHFDFCEEVTRKQDWLYHVYFEYIVHDTTGRRIDTYADESRQPLEYMDAYATAQMWRDVLPRVVGCDLVVGMCPCAYKEA